MKKSKSSAIKINLLHRRNSVLNLYYCRAAKELRVRINENDVMALHTFLPCVVVVKANPNVKHVAHMAISLV